MLNSPSGVNPRSFQKKKELTLEKDPYILHVVFKGCKTGPCSHIRCMNQDVRTIPMSQAKRLLLCMTFQHCHVLCDGTSEAVGKRIIDT